MPWQRRELERRRRDERSPAPRRNGGPDVSRIRTVKPEFWSSPDTAACQDPWARLLFIAMWNWADDQGRGTANPKELAGFAFPNDDHIDSTSIRRMLVEVSNAFGVILYRVGRRTYYAIPSWNDHQKIDRKSGPKCPLPEDGEPWDPDPDRTSDQQKDDESPTKPRLVVEDSTSTQGVLYEPSGTGTGEQGNRGTTTSVTADAETHEEPPPAKPAKPDEAAEFETWWKVWPRKVAKDAARKAYRSARRKKVTADHLLTSATAQVAAWKAAGKEQEFIPHASTWLNQARYNDEIERPKFTVITNPDSPWSGMRIDNSESPWAADMGWSS